MHFDWRALALRVEVALVALEDLHLGARHRLLRWSHKCRSPLVHLRTDDLGTITPCVLTGEAARSPLVALGVRPRRGALSMHMES